MKVIEFVPDYPTGSDMSQQVRDIMVATPEMRAVHQRLHQERAEEVTAPCRCHAQCWRAGLARRCSPA